MTRRPFRPQVFLFRTLVGIFIVQASLIAFSFSRCAVIAERREVRVVDECPNLSDKAEGMTNVMIATVLSLLVGSQITNK